MGTNPAVYVDPWRRPVLYLIRHCSTDLNSEDMYRGWADPEINAHGREEAAALANFFSYETLGLVASADFLRCIQTAEYIIPFSKLTHFVDINANLRTLNIGKFSGKPVNPQNEKELEKYLRDPNTPIPDGESLNGFLARWEETLNLYLVAARQETPTALVVEGCNIGATAYACLDGEDKPEFFDPYENTIVEPGGVVGVYLDERGQMSIEPRFGKVETAEILQE